MKPHRILISAHDPRNLAMAQWAGTLACLEWVVILACLIGMPVGGGLSYRFVQVALTVITVLMFVGWRGIICGHAKSFGSLVLFSTNLFFVLYFLVWTFWHYFKYNF